MESRRKCFVIMGYGVKTDFSTGRELNLDKTYKNIIKPAVEEAGLECIRADEIKHSGTIDVPMYQYLFDADVVIADLSTYNSNAFYELGVRHVFRPRTTIVIAENELQPPFDNNHTVIHKYEHLGKDIGYDEVMRFKKELIDLIKEILKSEDIDSPVYTYLKNLHPPIFDSNGIQPAESDCSKDYLGHIIEDACDALYKDNFINAKTLLQCAHSIDPNNQYIIQKLALATYKSKEPNQLEALKESLSILEVLRLEKTTDPETLGLAGAIYKRLWEETNCFENLNKAIEYYEKGFSIRNDYYNGINVAYLYNVRGSVEKDKLEAMADCTLANRIRVKVIRICETLYEDSSFNERSDRYWIAATLEEAYFAMGNEEKYSKMSGVSQSLTNENWQRETTKSQISNLKILLDKSPLKQ